LRASGTARPKGPFGRRLRTGPPSPPGGPVPLPRLVSAALLLASAAPVAAQTPVPGETEILVIGERLPLVHPQRSIAGRDLLAYGAGSVGELLDEIVAESGAKRGATFLVDGRRVPGLGEIDSYPAEAVERIEVLPQGEGARVGAAPGTRVFNVVLKPETRLAVGTTRLRTATDGGSSGGTADLSLARIRRPQRLGAALSLRRDGALLESERDVLQPAGSPAELGRFRTLRPDSRKGELNFTAADRLLPWLNGLAGVRFGRDRNRSRLGLTGTDAAIEQASSSDTLSLTSQLDAEWGRWLVSLEGGHRRGERRTVTSFGSSKERTKGVSRTSELELLAHGPLLGLPTGSLHLTLGARLRRDSLSGRGSGNRRTRFEDRSSEVRAGVEVPLSSRSGPWPRLGDLSVRAETRQGRSREFGRISDRNLGLRWTPAEWLNLSAQDSRSRSAPASDLVADPVLETAGVRIFDPVRLETVDVVAVTGGQSGLPPQKSALRSLTIDVRPVRSMDLLLTAEYSSARTDNILSVLPATSELVTRLFPERFVRAADGRLVRVDLRPVVFPRQEERQLRTALNLTLPLKAASRDGRLQVSGSLRFLLSSRLAVGQGLGSVDLLDRSAIALGGAMRPRREFDLTLGYSERGLGLRLGAERRSRSFLASSENSLLTFSPLTSFSLRAFVEGSRLGPQSTLLRGSRLGLTISNLANRRERVRDERGLTPLAFQPALRDPLGRLVEVELRKSF
jgi:iron complex outermembrane recepter protein